MNTDFDRFEISAVARPESRHAAELIHSGELLHTVARLALTNPKLPRLVGD